VTDIDFRRRGPLTKTFRNDAGFRLKRPSGPSVGRDDLDFALTGHEYEIRTEKDQVWLLEGERTVGFAKGAAHWWHVLLDDVEYKIEQPKMGNNHSLLSKGETQIGEFGGIGFPLRALEFRGELDIPEDQQAFVALIVLMGWREADRSLLGASATGASGV
jgi:hypothetical protein